MKFRRHLARVRRNMCALPNDSFEVIATLFFSSRSVGIWKRSSAPWRTAALSSQPSSNPVQLAAPGRRGPGRGVPARVAHGAELAPPQGCGGGRRSVRGASQGARRRRAACTEQAYTARVPPPMRGMDVTCSVQDRPQSTHLRSSSDAGAGAGGGDSTNRGMEEPPSSSGSAVRALRGRGCRRLRGFAAGGFAAVLLGHCAGTQVRRDRHVPAVGRWRRRTPARPCVPGPLLSGPVGRSEPAGRLVDAGQVLSLAGPRPPRRPPSIDPIRIPPAGR